MLRSKKLKKKITANDALARLEALCARAEQCTFDLRMKLIGWEIPSAEHNKILTSLKKNRFVDDQRFAIAFCRDKYRFSRWRRRKIAYTLKTKNISSATISNALDEIDNDEYKSILIDIIKTKARMIKNVDNYDGRTKLFRFAVSRGYEPSIVAEVIKDRRLWISEI